MAGIFPQLPDSALAGFGLLLAVGELDELEHAAAATSSSTLPRPSVNLPIPRLIQISL
jgi:hypothetical protein